MIQKTTCDKFISKIIFQNSSQLWIYFFSDKSMIISVKTLVFFRTLWPLKLCFLLKLSRFRNMVMSGHKLCYFILYYHLSEHSCSIKTRFFKSNHLRTLSLLKYDYISENSVFVRPLLLLKILSCQ